MQIIAGRTLRQFWDSHPTAEVPLRLWFARAKAADWTGPADIKAMFGANVDLVADNRVIFDIGRNKFRLIIHVAYTYRRVLIKFVGTHAEYDSINPETI
jgi:mRNA interferase HigB